MHHCRIQLGAGVLLGPWACDIRIPFTPHAQRRDSAKSEDRMVTEEEGRAKYVNDALGGFAGCVLLGVVTSSGVVLSVEGRRAGWFRLCRVTEGQGLEGQVDSVREYVIGVWIDGLGG